MLGRQLDLKCLTIVVVMYKCIQVMWHVGQKCRLLALALALALAG